MNTQSRIPVAVLGATGMVGQRFIELLQGHPWFELVALAASEQHGGRSYGEVSRWRLPGSEMPASVARLPVVACRPGALAGVKIVFSALPGEVAGEIEVEFARAGMAVFSNAKNYRMAADVPLIVPEVNADHAAAIVQQRKLRNWHGCIVTNANCSATPLVMALKPLQEAFGVRKVMVTTLQAISGAGYPGIPSYDILDNAIPYISPEEIIAAWQKYASVAQSLELPSAPEQALIYRSEPNRPQTLLDRDAGHGMSVTIGRLRPCPILSYKFVLLGHNTIRGAAGGSILNAELCVSKGLI